MPNAPVDAQSIRAHFPALASSTVFLDNAGGSQVPACVADAIRHYLLSSYAQLGGEYPESLAARRTVNAAHDFVRTFMGGDGLGHVVLGASTTQLCYLFANCFADGLSERPDRDELIISTAGHESDVGPWMRLATRGFTVQTWTVNDRTLRHEAADLRALLSPRTRLVAFPHVSNLLGDIEDARAITRVAHEAGARVLIDGVAFAPHRAIDVADIGCDFYLFSTYKVFGPHMAALFGRQEALSELTGPNHYFIPREQIPYKFELGGANHELCAGLLALPEYLRVLAGEPPTTEPCSRSTVVRAFERITALELPLQARLIDFITSNPEYRLIGPARTDTSRVCTIALVSSRRSSREIALAANAQGLGLRFGSFYSNRLARQLGLDETDGVVRISLAHYNTLAEVDRAIAFLKS